MFHLLLPFFSDVKLVLGVGWKLEGIQLHDRIRLCLATNHFFRLNLARTFCVSTVTKIKLLLSSLTVLLKVQKVVVLQHEQNQTPSDN